MKKIIIITLVLALATVSNATLQLTINGSAATSAATINVGGSVTLGILKSESVSVGTFVDFEPASGLGVFYNLQSLLPPDPGIPPEPSPYPRELGIVLPAAPGLYNIANLTGLANGDVMVIMWNGAGEEIVDTATVHIVPEPMTLALLGLGGVMLRRRK